MQKHFCIIIPAYNCEQYVEKNLESVLSQKYTNFEVVYVDDKSSDKTSEQVVLVANRFPTVKFSYCKNDARLLRGENIYNAITKHCSTDTIVVLVDGDDWLVDDQVLARVNLAYQSKDVWMTFGGFIAHPNVIQDKQQFNLHYPTEWIAANNYRSTRWAAPHLLTFYTWLYICIKKEDLMHQGQFIRYAEDFAMVMPMLEMAHNRWHCFTFEEPLYVYNRDNPLGTTRTVRFEQVEAEMILRKREKYNPL